MDPWDRTPLACMWWPFDCCCTLEACAPRNPGRLSVSAVKSLVAAALLRENPRPIGTALKHEESKGASPSVVQVAHVL